MGELIVYVSCADARHVAVFAMDRASGALAPRGTVPVPGPAGASMSMPLALSPDRRVLHAAVRIAPFPASSFAIDPMTGALSRIGGTDLPAAMAYILALDGHLLGASYPSAILSSHAVGADGAVAGTARQVVDTPLRAHAIVSDPAGRFVYVPCLGGDVVLQLVLDAGSGRMTQVGRMATHAGCGPRHMRFAPDGRFAYVLGELDGTITACTVDAAGGLHPVQTVATLARDTVVPTGTRIMAADIQITPDGRFLYASERMTEILSAWRIGPGGTLAPIGSFATEPMPRGFAIDPSGRFLLCASQTTGAVTCFAIDPATGGLARLATTPAGGNANWVEFFETEKR